MKLFVIILILSISVHQISAAAAVAAVVTTTTCKAANYCMGCHATIADQCTNCYNQVQNKIGMKQLDALVPITCATAAKLKVANSKQLDSKLVATSEMTNKVTIELCDPVKGKFLQQPFTGDSTCVATTLYEGVSAQAAGTGGVAGDTAMDASLLTNCQQHIAFGGTAVGVGAADQRMLCMYCKSKYVPTGTADLAGCTNAAGASYQCSVPADANEGLLTNCLFYKRTLCPQGVATNTICLGCKAGFAAATDMKTCVAYTTDANCRVLQSTTTECNICKDAYYWDALKCVLAAKMMIAGFAVVLSLVM